MLQTYTATLRNGQIEWGNEGKPTLAPNESVEVHVTILSRKSSFNQKLFDAMEAFAAAGGPTSFPEDVVSWQREQRVDRALPGREE